MVMLLTALSEGGEFVRHSDVAVEVVLRDSVAKEIRLTGFAYRKGIAIVVDVYVL